MKDKQQLIDAIEHVSFEMNRYLLTAYPDSDLVKGRYIEAVRESCLLHSRNIGEFFFDDIKYDDDIRVSHYYDELVSKDELEVEIKISRTNWNVYKKRIHKSLSHLTFKRGDDSRMNMQEKDEFNFDKLIDLFEKNLPIQFKEMWERGKNYSIAFTKQK
ncbi:MAG: hypothetical protein ACK4EY_12995 [Flavipsychrobacter sp.]